LIHIKDNAATSLIRVTWLWLYGGTKEPSGLDRTELFPGSGLGRFLFLAAFYCADGRISGCRSLATCRFTKLGAGSRALKLYQLNSKPRSQLAERRGISFFDPIAAGDLRGSNDAAVARRQTAPLGPLAITTSKFRPRPQRRHRPYKPGKEILHSRPHGRSP